MSETPTENYKNYMKVMNAFEITEELQKIQAIHHSLNESNPMSYVILLETNRKWFTASQIQWIEDRLHNLREKEEQSLQTSLEGLNVELAQAGILDKMCEHGEVKQISE
jgi:hypothetical protein